MRVKRVSHRTILRGDSVPLGSSPTKSQKKKKKKKKRLRVGGPQSPFSTISLPLSFSSSSYFLSFSTQNQPVEMSGLSKKKKKKRIHLLVMMEINIVWHYCAAACVCLGAIAKVHRSPVKWTNFVLEGGGFHKDHIRGFNWSIVNKMVWRGEAWSANVCSFLEEGGVLSETNVCSFRWASANVCDGPQYIVESQSVD